ncbi:hypothetical protein [Enterobacter soli]|uniref:hypothetical protein n=1 Tax=Enterobacter soli TaxID=885040 RepID=UPI0034CE851D
MEFTKERLLKIQSWSETYGPGSNVVLPAEEAEELARIVLASLEAPPAGYIDAEYAELLRSGHIESCSVYAEAGEGCITLYAAPPSPVSVPDEYVAAVPTPTNLGYEAGWNACRAAMLDQEKSNG